MLIIPTYTVSIKKIFSNRSNYIELSYPLEQTIPFKKRRVATNSTYIQGFFIFLSFFFLSLIPSPFYSLFGLPLPTPLTICIQFERDPTNPL